MGRKHHDISYEKRKVLHWNRFGTPSQIDPETGAAAPLWAIEDREAQRKKILEAGRRRQQMARGYAQAAE